MATQKPRIPASYEIDVSSASVDVGDLIVGFDTGLSTSGVATNKIIERSGYDEGAVIVYVATENGSISLSQNGYIIHTGRQKAIGVNATTYKSPQGSSQMGTIGVADKGDVVIGWDEDSHGDDFYNDLSADKDLLELYGYSSSIYHNILQAKYDNTTIKRDRTCCIEGELIKLVFEVFAPPVGLSANAKPDDTVDLSWSCDQNPDAFFLKRSRGGNEHTINIPGTDRTYTDSEVTTGFNYNYRVLSTQVEMSDVNTRIDTFTEDRHVSTGDIVAIFSTPAPTGVSLTKILDQDIELYIADESGTLSVDSSSDVDVVHTGLGDTTSIDNYNVTYSAVGSSTEIIHSDLSQAGLIFQWDDGSVGESDGGYWSFTGEEDNLYSLSTGSSARRVNQAITQGDVSRDKSSDVYLAVVELDLSPTSGLDKIISDDSEDQAYVGIDHDPIS